MASTVTDRATEWLQQHPGSTAEDAADLFWPSADGDERRTILSRLRQRRSRARRAQAGQASRPMVVHPRTGKPLGPMPSDPVVRMVLECLHEATDDLVELVFTSAILELDHRQIDLEAAFDRATAHR